MNLSSLPETNWVDLIVLIFLIRGSYIGINLGFSIELFKALGVVGSTVLSLLYFNQLGQWLSAHSFVSLQIADFLSFLILFFALLFVFRVIRILLFKIFHLELFYGLEKWGGFTLGLARSVVLASLFVFTLTLTPIGYLRQSVEQKSLSGPFLKQVAPKVVDFMLLFKPKLEGDLDET